MDRVNPGRPGALHRHGAHPRLPPDGRANNLRCLRPHFAMTGPDRGEQHVEIARRPGGRKGYRRYPTAAAIDRRSFLASGAAAVAVAELPAGTAAAQSQTSLGTARWTSSSSGYDPQVFRRDRNAV
jgi:hypothetical protein